MKTNLGTLGEPCYTFHIPYLLKQWKQCVAACSANRTATNAGSTIRVSPIFTSFPATANRPISLLSSIFTAEVADT